MTDERSALSTPLTRDAAIDVPLSVAVELFCGMYAATIADPGANRSLQVPKFEKLERVSVIVVDPTVIADGSRAGDWVHELVFKFPAETVNTIPALTAAATA